jgi:hypothetical protein
VLGRQGLEDRWKVQREAALRDGTGVALASCSRAPPFAISIPHRIDRSFSTWQPATCLSSAFSDTMWEIINSICYPHGPGNETLRSLDHEHLMIHI